MGKEIKKCVIVSGAPETDLSYYKQYLDDCYLICADSGYKKCEQLSVIPNLIIGDFDSSDYPDVDCEIITLDVRKDDTDTFHCVQEAIERGFNSIIILGGIGSRFDHSYANILSLNYCFDNGIDSVLINGNNKIKIIDNDVILNNSQFEHFSLYSLFQPSQISIKGALYELDHYLLQPYDQLTQSNGFLNNECKIIVHYGKILLIQCND